MLNRYEEEYRRKLTDVEGALAHIKSGDCIVSGVAAGEAMLLLSQLHTLHGKVDHITAIGALEFGMHPFRVDPKYRDTFEMVSMFCMGPARAGIQEGMASYFPTNIHNMASRQFGYRRPNVAFLACSPMDKHGYLRIPMSLVYERELVEQADFIIAEVNPNLPKVNGETEIHISQIGCVVESNEPVPTLARRPLGDEDVAIGKYIASLVNDGDTIQLGIGAIPDAVAQELMDKHDLGVHTEMITSTLADLVEAGVVTGRKKSLHPGKIVGAFALGDQKLYDMLDDNPSVAMMRGCYVNNPWVVAQNDNMVSINTCISVDLVGQVNSESIGTRQYSGTGGQVDTAYGAIHAKNGRSIIALHSTAKGGTVSTINAVLAPGAVVTLSRNNVDYIVTEHGIAPMRGRTVRERVDNLIAVAHPDFRAQLRADAEKYMLR